MQTVPSTQQNSVAHPQQLGARTAMAGNDAIVVAPTRPADSGNSINANSGNSAPPAPSPIHACTR
jgi:hypothetical protein